MSAGSAAIHYAIQTLTRAGDNIVTTPQLYGGTYTLFAHLLPSFGVDVRFARDDSAEAIAELIDDNTKLVYCESIGNPAGISRPPTLADGPCLCVRCWGYTVATQILCKPSSSVPTSW